MNAVRFPVSIGDMITISWSGELRTVVFDTDDDGLIVRDLTEDESEKIAEAEAAAMDEVRSALA